MSNSIVRVDISELALLVPNGAKVAIPTTRSGVAMALTRALIKRGVKDLHLIAIPTAGLQADLLIGAGCVATVESAGITLDEYGQAPCFVAAVKAGTIKLKDSTCPAILAALQAGEKGIPFIPLRGLIGSDLAKHRDEYKIIDNPFAQNDPIIALPAIVPDVALFHAPLADRFGNVWIGAARELMTMAHASRQTLVTAETIIDGNLLDDAKLAPAVVPSLYITGVAQAEKGAWPLGLAGQYKNDPANLSAYMRMAGSSEGFTAYLNNDIPALAAAQ